MLQRRRFYSQRGFQTPPKVKQVLNDLFVKKPLSSALKDVETRSLKRCLTAFDLTTFGLGAIIGKMPRMHDLKTSTL